MVQCECNKKDKFLFIFQFFVSCIDASFCAGLCECSFGFVWICMDLYEIIV